MVLNRSKMLYFDESRVPFSPYGFACEVWKAVPMSRPDSHDEIEINYLEKGTITYLLGGHQVTVQAQSFSLFWAATPHQIIGSSDVSYYYVVTIPFELFLQWHFPKVLLSRLIMGEMVNEAPSRRVAHDLANFKQWNQDLKKRNGGLFQIVQLEMAARLLRLASCHANCFGNEGTAKGDSHDIPAKFPGKAELMARFVAQNYRSRIQIQDIANAVELHPDYASTLFRQTFGTTLSTLITKHRVADAQRQLLTTDDSITNVALAAGFHSLSRFNLAFKENARMTPGKYRKLKQSLLPRNHAESG